MMDAFEKYDNYIKKFNWDNNYSEYWLMNIPNKINNTVGFKIHISASIINAQKIAEIFLEYVKDKNVNFKIISSLKLLEKQNIGQSGYSQVGKFITVYPEDNNELKILLEEFNLLFKSFNSPKIPSDFQYKLSSVVYYRYGEIIKTYSFQDKRDKTLPEGVIVPIKDYYIKRLNSIPDHLIILKAIKKNGKGSVYKCLDTKIKKIVILKEGHLQGNMNVFNVDSLDFLTNERNILKLLENMHNTPEIIDDFYIGNSYFLELNMLEGESLYEILKKRSLSNRDIIRIIINICFLIEELHNKYNIIHRDISFYNILILNEELSVIDFEYSYKKNQWNYKTPPFGTIGFYDPNKPYDRDEIDTFAIVRTLYFVEHFDEYIDYKQNGFKEMKFLDEKSPFSNIYSINETRGYKSIKSLIKDLKTLEGAIL